MKAICQRCRSSILTRLHHQSFASSFSASSQVQTLQFRNYSDRHPTVSGTPPPPKPRQSIADDVTIPSAISSATPGVSQPLSTPESVHVDVDPTQPAKAAKSPVERPPSSCIAGTKLNGLNYFKNKPDVIALEDWEYPEWLWSLLDAPKEAKKGGVDPSTLNKKQRKRYEKKMAARAATLPPQIPAHHQATDITPAAYNSGDEVPRDPLVAAAESLEKRSEITKSSRVARRKAIREDNFLRSL